MKKKLTIVALFLLLTLVLTGCACKHEWVEATCTLPKTCQKCEEVEGEALGHTWVDADCVTPKTCSVCAATEGEALGHTWVDADCVTPKTCTVCAATEGEALGHTFVDADCVTPKTCTVCAATEGELGEHSIPEGENTCTVCGVTIVGGFEMEELTMDGCVLPNAKGWVDVTGGWMRIDENDPNKMLFITQNQEATVGVGLNKIVTDMDFQLFVDSMQNNPEYTNSAIIENKHGCNVLAYDYVDGRKLCFMTIHNGAVYDWVFRNTSNEQVVGVPEYEQLRLYVAENIRFE